MAIANEFGRLVWIHLGLLLSLALLFPMVSAQAQPRPDGFITIDCGATTNHTEVFSNSTLPYTTDDDFINVGINRDVTLPSGQSGWTVFSTARYFTEGRSKYCYALPVRKNTTYLIRAQFMFGDLETAVPDNFGFSMSIDSTVVDTVSLTSMDAYTQFYRQLTFATLPSQLVTHYCLIPDVGNPFISSLELRPLVSSTYLEIQFNNKYTRILDMINCGAPSTQPTVRYPDDPFDRFWTTPGSNLQRLSSVSTRNPAAVSNSYPDDVPTKVLQSAWSNIGWYSVPFPYPDTSEFYSALYFADFQDRKSTDIRAFDIYLNTDRKWSTNFTIGSRVSEEGWSPVGSTVTQNFFNLSFVATPASTLNAILNGAELHAIYPTETATTDSRDVDALNDLRRNLNLLSWTGDPCLPVSWSWITCSTNSPPRVTQLKLSSYGVKGTVPTSIVAITALTDLWLDNNFISGPIPDLSGLSYLETLHLQNNSFTGTIPASLASLADLSELYVGDNNLSGTVPAALENKSGLDLKAVNAFGNGSPSSGSASNTSSTPPKKKSSSSGAIIGAAIGIVLVILLIAFVVLYCCCMKVKKKEKISKGGHTPLQEVISVSTMGSPLFEARSDVSIPNGYVAGGHHVKSTRGFSKEEVQVATNNFKRKIGVGGFGPVYYGELPAGEKVAVKVNSATSGQGSAEFATEVSLLSRVHHKNLVSLVGYCDEGTQQILIYEYMPNGTLREHLYGKGVTSVVDWKTRLDIALNSARGLEYLHNDCSPKIIHRDVKSNNILLSEKLVAKVADFGISKLAPDEDTSTGVSTVVKGTMGYLDPEYFQTQKLTQKSDVYAFGVVLLEIIAGRAPIDDKIPAVIERILVEFARGVLGEGNLDALADKSLQGTYNVEAMWKLAELAMFCVEPRGINRPDMRQVVKEVTEAIDLENMTTPANGNTQTSYIFNPSNNPTQSSVQEAYSGTYPSTPPTRPVGRAPSGGVDPWNNPRPR